MECGHCWAWGSPSGPSPRSLPVALGSGAEGWAELFLQRDDTEGALREHCDGQLCLEGRMEYGMGLSLLPLILLWSSRYTGEMKNVLENEGLV